MNIDNTTISIIMMFISVLGIFVESIVHWDKIRPVMTSHAAISVARTLLLVGCFWLGPWSVIAGANFYIILSVIDFIRTNDNSCGAIGCAILTAALGVFNFAIQFAFSIKDR